jgi:hypothetical protein
MKDAVATMGALLPEDSGGRDAVHVAVFSATSMVRVYAGQDVGMAKQSDTDSIVSPLVATKIGIVDPFIKGDLHPGARFWVFLYPRTITALSHRWSHPAFEQTVAAYAPPSSKLASEQWLRDFIKRSDCPDYEMVIAEAAKWWDGRSVGWSDDYLHFDDRDAHGDIPSEFWDHIAVVLGRPMQQPDRDRPSYFSCAC